MSHENFYSNSISLSFVVPPTPFQSIIFFQILEQTDEDKHWEET